MPAPGKRWGRCILGRWGSGTRTHARSHVRTLSLAHSHDTLAHALTEKSGTQPPRLSPQCCSSHRRGKHLPHGRHTQPAALVPGLSGPDSRHSPPTPGDEDAPTRRAVGMDPVILRAQARHDGAEDACPSSLPGLEVPPHTLQAGCHREGGACAQAVPRGRDTDACQRQAHLRKQPPRKVSAWGFLTQQLPSAPEK